MPVQSPSHGDPLGLVGSTIERRFRIDSEVAEGGFGIVYRGYQIALDRPVAIKVLKVPSDLSRDDMAQFQRNFAAEARTIGRLRHPNIVEVYDFGVTSSERNGAVPWMALEWLDGRTLESALDRRRGQTGLSPAAALGFLRPVVQSIAYAHRQGIVHRDLKPANIMLVNVHGATLAKVLDFGIAKLVGADERTAAAASTGRTANGNPFFSPAYAAPEQVAFGRTGPWTDVHALGLILTEMLTNRPPYGKEEEVFEWILAPKRPTPAAKGVDVGDWERVLARALAQRPSDRFSNADELLEALERNLPPDGWVPQPISPPGAGLEDDETVIQQNTIVHVPDATVVDRQALVSRPYAARPAETPSPVSAFETIDLRNAPALGRQRAASPDSNAGRPSPQPFVYRSEETRAVAVPAPPRTLRRKLRAAFEPLVARMRRAPGRLEANPVGGLPLWKLVITAIGALIVGALIASLFAG